MELLKICLAGLLALALIFVPIVIAICIVSADADRCLEEMFRGEK